MFELISKYKPAGDQPEAIKELVEGINEGKRDQVLLGATGTGKTFTIANVIASVNKPTLVLAHNKTLAGQLYAEFKELFPNNKVELFISYYDYYQPEAYVPSSDTYIEKDSSINDEIDELRHRATSSLISRNDVIVVASVSCIYGIGEVEEYKKKMLTLNVGDTTPRDDVLKKLVEMLYERNDFDLKRGTFRVRGDSLEIIPANERTNGLLIEWFGDEIDRISEVDTVTGHILKDKKTASIFAASHFVTDEEKLKISIDRILKEKDERVKYFKENNKLIEAQRIEERVNYDMEMLSETGFCRGIENYSRHIALKEEGVPPCTLIDFFPKDFLLVIDESHVTVPQIRGMYNGDRMRKQTLVDYGFRLPSAMDNRPLKFDEFNKKVNQVIYVSATPGDYELELVNNNNLIIIDRMKILKNEVFKNSLYYNEIDAYDNLLKVIEMYNNSDKKLKHNTVIIIGFDNFVNEIEKMDINKLFKEAKKTNSFNFIIIDNESSIKKYNYDDWYRNNGVGNSGIWLGSGITEQYVIKIAKMDRKLYQEIKYDFGYKVENGIPVLVKLINFVGDDDE